MLQQKKPSPNGKTANTNNNIKINNYKQINYILSFILCLVLFNNFPDIFFQDFKT